MLLFLGSAEKLLARVLPFLVEEGCPTHSIPEAGWRVEMGWPTISCREEVEERTEEGKGTKLKYKNLY